MPKIKINQGSDFTLSVLWQLEDGSIRDLTGYSVDVYDINGIDANDLTATITNPSLGEISVVFNWDDQTAGAYTGERSFRVRITDSGGLTTASPRIFIEVV